MAEGFTPSEDDLTEIRKKLQERDAANQQLNDHRNLVLETDNPDDAAYDLKKSQEVGIPREAIGGAREEYRAEDTLRKMQEMRQTAPRTSEWLAEPSNFAIAKDDTEQLTALEDILLGMIEYKNYAGRGVASAPNALLQNLELYGMRIADNPRAAAINTVNPVPFVDLGVAADAALTGRVKVRGGEEIAAFGDRAAKGFRNPFAGGKAKVKLPGRAFDADPVASQLTSAFARAHERRKIALMAEKEKTEKDRPQTDTRTGGLLVSAERSAAEMLPYMALGLATRNPEMTMAGMEASIAGESYGRYSLDPSLTEDQRLVLSGIMGKAERIGESAVLRQLFGGKEVVGGFTKRFLTSMAMENVQEQSTTIIQDFAEWQIANPEKTAQEWLDERGDRAFDTFVVTTLASGPVNAAVIATEQAMTEIGKDTRETEMSPGDTLIATMLEKAGQSKLRTRSPEKFAEAVEKQIKDTGTETVTVDLDGLAQSLEAAGLSVADTLEEMGVPADAISETAVVMGSVEIPTARLLASEAAQKHRDKIQPHLRLADDPLTPAQKEAVGAEVMKQAQFISDDISAKIKDDADFAGQIAEVEDQVTEQLRGAGFSGQTSVLRANAVLASRMAGYVAKKRGQDVRDVWKDIGPKIVGSFGEAGTTDVLRQAEEGEYPVAPRSEWYGDANFQQTGGRAVTMTPDEFLSRVRPLEIDDVARDNIDDLKRHIQSGKTLDPLALRADGKEDGRHRAIAAKELGIASLPVLVWGNEDIQSAPIDLSQSIRQAARMDMTEVKQWVIDNVTATESDFPNGDVLTVIKFPLTEDDGAPEVMLSIRLKERANQQNGRADVNLFLDNQMADALDSVEDPAERGTLAKIMFAKTVMVMRQYAAEYDVKAFNFVAAESQAEGTNAKSREDLYRFMLSSLPLSGYTAYELDNQMSVVREQDGAKSADPLFPSKGFVLVRDGVNVEEYARSEIIRGSQRGGDAGEVVTVLTATRLGRKDTGDGSRRGRGGAGAADAGGAGQQGDLAQERRGGYSPSTRQMVFTEARDLSTFMHETAHWFLDTLEKLAPTEAWAAADLAEIDAWYQGVKDTPKMAAIRARYGVVPTAEGWQVTYDGQPMERPRATEAEAIARIEWRERQEAFAESFEEYLMTGKAPVPKLLDVFRAFRDWLVNLYKGMLPGERANLNPAIQAVFDRVLMVDTEVDAASSEAFRDADTMAKDMLAKGVITERQYRMVGERLNKAREEVKEEMIARALKEEMRTREDWWAKEKLRVKGDLARAFDKSEVGRAFNWLAYGEWMGDLPGAPATKGEAESTRSDEMVFQEGVPLGQSAARLQGSPLAIKGSGPGGRVLNWDLGMAFTERHMKKYGRALDPADPADYKIILKSMLQDFKEQSAQQDTGDAWYTDDINEAIALTAQIYPELNTSTQFRDLFLTVTALLSPQQKPVQNWENAILAMRSWRETGRIEFLKPSGKQYGVLSHTTGLKMFQHLVDTIGLEAALVWVKTEHTGREVAEMRMASGLFSPIDKATGKVSTKVKDYLASETNLNESLLGIYGFGPKVGDFMQNSVGIDQNAVTVDLWLARTYNRLIGRLTDVSPKQAEDGGIASEIRGRAEREHIKRLVRDAAKKAGLDPSAMQAALWYFEQRLYRAHGIKSDSQNFSGAARTALQTRAIDVRSSESNQRTAGQDVREGVRGGGSQQAGDGRGSDQGRSYAPLAGAPGNLQGPIPELVAVAEQYARQAGINLRRQAKYADVDADRGARIAQAYEDMKHAPNDPAVQEAYADLIRQTRAQYEALVEAGYVFTFFDGASDPYAGNPSAAMRDLRNNKRMAVYGTYDGYGTEGITAGALADNPMLADTGLQWADQSGVMRPVVANDLFRAVHDAMGHGLEGAGFRARGEENAWQAHVRLFTGPAVGAITSETRGQNSWLNYGPYGETNRTATLENTIFAEQKTGLMPEWTWIEGRVADMTTDTNETLSQTKAPIFYSALSRFIENNKTTKAPASQWKGMITNAPGIKVEEVEMSGVMDWLDLQEGPVTREALAAFVAANGVTVEEVVKGAPLGGNNVRLEEIQREMLPLIEERDRIRLRQQELNAKIESRTVTDEEKREYKANSNRFVELGDLLDPLQQEQYNLSSPSGADTKWSSHTLPGGENYTELLLRLPDSSAQKMKEYVEYRDALYEKYGKAFYQTEASEQELQKLAELSDATGKVDPQFRSSHWSEPNVLAHARFKERVGPNGERVLALEEIQSDWHQAGREGGYQDPKAMADARAEADKASADRAQAFEDMKAALVRDDVQKLVSSAGTQQERDIVASLSSGQVSRNPMSIDIVRNAVAAHMRNPRLSEESRAAMMGSYEAFRAATSMFDVATRYTSSLSRNVPNAPFKNNAWTELVLKRMIRYAAENGFDAVAWIPGNIQNGRVVETDDNRGDFYDKIVPNAANKIGKKFGAKAGRLALPTGQGVENDAGEVRVSVYTDDTAQVEWDGGDQTFNTVEEAEAFAASLRGAATQFHSLPITPQLREAALNEGFPLFQSRTFNPPGHGAVPPPPNVPPVRLDLKLVKDLYGEDALRKLPAAVRRRSSTSSNVTDMLAMIETVRKTLSKKKKGPQTLTQFIMKQKRKDANGVMTGGLNGIKGAADELRAMGLERLINEKSGTTLDYVREAAEEAGFIRPAASDVSLTREAGDLDATPNDLLDALAREARGEAVVRIEDEGANREMTDARTWATWLEQNGVDIYETDKKKLRASVEAMLSNTDESLVSPDQAAELFGFANGEELLSALAEVGNRDKFLDAQADRALANEFGDMMKDGTLIEEAREAARLSILGRQSEIELEALSRAVGQQASANYARQMARDIIGLRTVKEIAAYERDLDNERRFSKQALAAVAKGDYAAALKAKQRQIIAAQMYREGKKAHERIEKQRRDLMKYLTSEGRREKIANDYLERIDAVLDEFELRVSKQGPSVQKARQSAAAYVAWMTEQGREAEIAPEAMLLATQANLKTWRNLTADEVDYLVGTIENMAHLGRTKQRLLNDKEKRQREAILDELTATLAAAPSAKTSRERSFTPTVGEGVATWLRKAHARLTRMEFQFARLDGREGGPLHTALFQPFADAADRETSRMREAAVRMQDLYAAFTTGERSALFNRRISTPELKVPGKGLTLMDAVVIGLNCGNAGNRQALVDGYGWEPAAIEAMLNRVLTDKHWDFIEGVWDLIGSYREDAFALEKSITGVAPKAVEGISFTLANGRKIEGKYYPLKYDSGQARADSVKQARLDEKQMLSEMGKSFSKPMTKTGHLIERVGSGGKPVKLSIGVFHEHVASVIHDIAYRRSIIDVYKLVTSPRFADAYIQAAGREQYDTLVPWIAQIANERKDEPGGYVTDILRGARRNFSIMAMGLKVGTAVQQATGVLQAVPLIGSRYAAQGFFKAIGGGPASFWSAWNWVSQKSEFMRDRPSGFDRDVREVTNKLQERTPLGAVRRNAFILIGVMDTAVSTGVWIGAYDKALDGNVPGMDKGDEEAAIAYADSIVRRSQVAGRMQDLPQMMRGTELEKLMTVVYSYFSGLYNETASEVLRVRGGQLNPLAFSANMTLLYVVIPLVASALAGRLFADDDDEELDEKIGKEIASNAVSTIPFVRDVINATINPQFGYQLSPAGSIIEGGTKAASNLATGEGFGTEYATKQSLNLMGLLFGLPTGQLFITGEYLYGVATGEEDPAADPADAAREALLRDSR